MSPTRNLRPEAETLKLALEAEAGLEESAQQGNPKQTGILCFFCFLLDIFLFCFVGFWAFLAGLLSSFGVLASGLSFLVCCLLGFHIFLLSVKTVWLPGFFTFAFRLRGFCRLPA